MRVLTLLLLPMVLLATDIRVVLVNGTNDGPGKADQVIIMDLSQGMSPIANQGPVSGEVHFHGLNISPPFNLLIQANLDGVTYSGRMMESSPAPSGEFTTQVVVYDSSTEPEGLNVTYPFFYVMVQPDDLYIQKRMVFENHSEPARTFQSPDGVVEFHLPKDSMRLDFVTFKSGTMPLRVVPMEGKQGQTVPKPLKPGHTELDVAYYQPYDADGTTVKEIVYYPIEHFHLFVSPANIGVFGEGMVNQGVDQDNNMAIYAFTDLQAGQKISFTLSGQGVSPQQAPSQSQGRVIIGSRYDRSLEISIVIALLIIGVASIGYNWNRENPEEEQVSRRDALRDQRKELLKEYQALTSNGQEASIADKDRILNRLVTIYKALD